MSEEKFNLEKFVEGQKQIVEKVGFFEEYSMNEFKRILQRNCQVEFTKEYYPENIISSGDGFVVKWKKRYFPISQEELDKIYNIKKIRNYATK